MCGRRGHLGPDQDCRNEKKRLGLTFFSEQILENFTQFLYSMKEGNDSGVPSHVLRSWEYDACQGRGAGPVCPERARPRLSLDPCVKTRGGSGRSLRGNEHLGAGGSY